MKKRVLSLFLAIAMVAILLASCGTAGNSEPGTTPEASLSNTPVTTTETPETSAPSTSEADTSEKTGTPAQNITYTGHISATDGIVDISGIVIEALWYTPMPWTDHTPGGTIGTIYRQNYDYCKDSRETFRYLTTMSPDKDGNFSFTAPADMHVAIQIDCETIPTPYGIYPVNYLFISNFDYDNPPPATVKYRENTNIDFVIGPIERYGVYIDWDGDDFFLAPIAFVNNKRVAANLRLYEARFADNFVEAMIEGTDISYSGKIQCGGVDVATVSNTTNIMFYLAGYWEWRVNYLYYNNYITKAQYDEIFSTREPSKVLPIM